MSNPYTENDPNDPYADRTKRKPTTEKLAEIRAKCVELLAIAEKRTHGRWLKEKGYRKGEVVLLSNEGAILEIECAMQRERSMI